MNKGEHWAYRASRKAKFAEVEVLKVGVANPPRIKVEFVDDAFEGKQQWVSPARLEVVWDDFDEYFAQDLRWKALWSAPRPDEVTWEAAQTVWFADAVGDDNLTLENEGIAVIKDLDRLCEHLGIQRDDLRIDELAVEGGDGLNVPWSTTAQIVQMIAVRYSDKVLAFIEAEERKAEIESVTGYDFRWTRNDPEIHVPAEIVARNFEKRIAPVHKVVRSWIGAPAEERLEIVGLRHELSRVGDIALRAIKDLKRLRSNRTADGLLDELLNPTGFLSGHGSNVPPVEPMRAEYRWVRVDDQDAGQSAESPQEPQNGPYRPHH